MNKCTYDIIKSIFIECSGLSVLEVGSRSFRGWSLRGLFNGNKYVGIDMNQGEGVDIVCSSHNMQIESDSIDLIICTSMLEHDSNPTATIKEMKRVLKSTGKILITVPFYWSKHSFPDDYWRFTSDGLRVLFETEFGRVQTFEIGRKFVPHTVVAAINFTVGDLVIKSLNKKWSHENGRLYELIRMFTPPIMISLQKLLMYGRMV